MRHAQRLKKLLPEEFVIGNAACLLNDLGEQKIIRVGILIVLARLKTELLLKYRFCNGSGVLPFILSEHGRLNKLQIIP